MEGCNPLPTHPGPQQARIATSGSSPTGLFWGILREVSGKNAILRPIGKRAIFHGEKPACLELVSFEKGEPPQDTGHGSGREYETPGFEDPGFRAEIPGHFRFPVPDIF